MKELITNCRPKPTQVGGGKRKVSILIPCYNEQESMPLLYPELKKVFDSNMSYEWEALFIDDGSSDKTLDLIKDLRNEDNRISYVALSRNFGKENAMLAGFDYVTGDCVVIIDADLQDPPCLIPEMLRYWEEGYKDVYAKRATRGRESWLRKQLSLLFYKILSKSSRFDVLQNVGDFRLLDRQCIEALKKIRESERYTKGMFCWIGYEKKEIVFNRGDRLAGRSNWNLKQLLKLAVDGIMSFSIAPLRIATFLGGIIALLSFLYALYFILKTLIFGEVVQGFTTLIVMILFLGGLQLMSIGIVGEYIGRIYNETKNRPTYLAKEYNGNRVFEI